MWVWFYFVSFDLVFDVIMEVCKFVGRILIEKDRKVFDVVDKDFVVKIDYFE